MQQSRLTRREETKTYRKIRIAFVVTLAIIIFILFWGLSAILNLAVFVSGLKGDGDITTTSQNNLPLSPPYLESSFEATNTANISIRGRGLPKNTVIIYVNDSKFNEKMIGENGTFTIEDVRLIKGENKIWGILENNLKKKSENSKILTIFYNNELPKLEITEPSEGAIISNETKSVKISGQTVENITVTVNNRFVIVNSDNKFEYNLPLNDGENKLEIIAKDEAGNTNKIEIKVTFNAP